MGIRAVAVVLAGLALAGGAQAGGFAPVTSVSTAPVVGVAPEPLPLEWLRIVGPQVGRDVVVPVNGVPVATIEWRREVAVRVRTESGAPLSLAEQASVRATAMTCRHGEVRSPMERTEPNGTYVVEYACAWLQGS
jgi:hypothetical protein